jgi:hypothetical protein
MTSSALKITGQFKIPVAFAKSIGCDHCFSA